MDAQELVEKYNVGERAFGSAYLVEADLRRAVLREAKLSEAILNEAKDPQEPAVDRSNPTYRYKVPCTIQCCALPGADFSV